MLVLCRFIVASELLNAGAICSARAQAEPQHVVLRGSGWMYAFGVMLDEGLGVEIDEHRAFEWYRRAAKLGHAESMNRLGILYLQGRGVPQNTLSARSWFRLAVAQGSLTAINNIALLYFYGLGVHQSYSKAARMLRIFANRGNADGQNKLGMMYERGLGVVPDHRRATKLLLKSAAQGYSPAIVNLGLMLTQESNADTRDALPCPFVDQSNALACIQLEFPGFSGHVGVFVQLFRIPQDLRRLNDYGGALDCRKNQCSQISRPVQVREFCKSFS